ncbi:hypothetical protein SLG_05160 [Sphingobium sp. SYK-6]|uniref:RES family NAD+ phosphorylase n=1 Tax=Sphingobium sp. (strain NBRC 103272 / SYK-6) TaxID=627192 RepID=UPI00022766D7|nr:RES family NAD+ phosphorylase [Sphingobium sp. SYK-6]BAK65191.1 hypothetical protein SLG_05160 [Sphingobium sp. SYK-6]
MIVHRLCKAAHVALDGEGARLWGGRWNSAGRPMVYTAASPGLAVLEVLVHLDLPSTLLPDDYQLLAIEIPDDAPVHRIEPRPVTDAACRRAGDDFLTAGAALVLMVRSVIVSQEWNMLLNPRHPAMSGVAITRTDPFRFDSRLFP